MNSVNKSYLTVLLLVGTCALAKDQPVNQSHQKRDAVSVPSFSIVRPSSCRTAWTAGRRWSVGIDGRAPVQLARSRQGRVRWEVARS